MKKRIVVIILIGSCFFFSKHVYAKKFKEDVIFPEYSIKTYRKNPVVSISRTIYQFTDEEGKVFYYLNPTKNYFGGYSYYANISDLDQEVLKEISKVIYYGYGYKNQKSLEYYAATQYLLFKAYKEYTITFIDENRKQVFPFQDEIAQIEENMKKNEFQFDPISTIKRNIVIDNPYIIKNFKIQGKNLNVEEKEGKIEITLLNNLKDYTLEFIPKMDCSNVEVYGNNNNIQFIHMDLVCENTYTRKINVEEEKPLETKENEVKPLQNTLQKENKEEKNGKNKENIVHVPATGKENFSWLLILFLLGDAYYVFKK